MNITDRYDDERHTSSTAFLLWLACLFGACGIHRFYLGRYGTGLLYLLTFGLLGVGQVLDLFGLRNMVRRANAERELPGRRPRSFPLLPPARMADSKEILRVKLLHEAGRRAGQLTVSQGVMATGRSFNEVERLLDEMVKSDYVGIENDPQTGAVVYTFGELAPSA